MTRQQRLKRLNAAVLLSLLFGFGALSLIGVGQAVVIAQDDAVITAEDRSPAPGNCEQGFVTNCLLLEMQEQVTTVIDREANILCGRGRVGPVGGTTCIAADALAPALMVITDGQSGRVLLAALDPQERLGGIMTDETFVSGQSQQGNLAVSVILSEMPSEIRFLSIDGQDIGVEYPADLGQEKLENLDRIKVLPVDLGE